jgi:hypothetical protein
MINPKELRIGNLLNWEAEHLNAGISIVILIEENYFVIRSEYAWVRSDDKDQHIERIPLTPEWLDRCGFKRPEQREYFELNGIYICLDDNECRLCEEDAYEGNIIYIGKPFRYVHQLQNIYFDLTQEELIIKVTV